MYQNFNSKLLNKDFLFKLFENNFPQNFLKNISCTSLKTQFLMWRFNPYKNSISWSLRWSKSIVKSNLEDVTNFLLTPKMAYDNVNGRLQIGY
jgi:hypothetical protein